MGVGVADESNRVDEKGLPAGKDRLADAVDSELGNGSDSSTVLI